MEILAVLSRQSFLSFQIYTIARHSCQRPGIKQLKFHSFVHFCICCSRFESFVFIPSLQQARQIRQRYNCHICTSYCSFTQSSLPDLRSEVMVSNQPSGNCIRFAGPIVLWGRCQQTKHVPLVSEYHLGTTLKCLSIGVHL